MSFLDRWRTLSPLLDEALDLPPADRGAWLDALRGRDPDRAADIEALLVEHAALASPATLYSTWAIALQQLGRMTEAERVFARRSRSAATSAARTSSRPCSSPTTRVCCGNSAG